MRVAVSRASVCAADDIEPHDRMFEFAEDARLSKIVTAVAASDWLARISGGLATWSVTSNRVIAVVAQQWPAPKLLPFAEDHVDRLDWRDGVLFLHFNYHTQIDPKTVYDIFWNLRLRA